MAEKPASDLVLLRFLPARARAFFERSEELQRALSNMNWLVVQSAVEAVVTMLVSVWTARYLAPERFGTFNYAIAFVQMFTPLATLGLGSTVVRDIVKAPDATPLILGTTTFLRALGGVALVVATFVAIHFVRPGDPATWIFVAIVGVGHGLRNLGAVELWFQATLHARPAAIARALARLLGGALRIAVILAGAGLTVLVAAYALETAVPVLALLLCYRMVSQQPLTSWRVDRAAAKQLLSDSWPLVFSGFMSMVYMRIDQVMLGDMRGDQEVGLYAVAVRLSEAFFALPTLVLISLFPWLIRARSISLELYHTRFQRVYDVFVWCSIVAGLLMQLAASPIVSLFFGEQYAAAGPVLAVHFWGGLFWFSGSAGHRYLVAENHTKITLFMTTCGALTNVLLNLWLIPRFGALGSAYATLASFAVSHWLSAALFKASRPMLWYFVRAFDPVGLGKRWRRLGA